MIRVVGDNDPSIEEREARLLSGRISQWRAAIKDPGNQMYLIWEDFWTNETKARWRPLYQKMISSLGEEKVRFATRKSWGKSLFRNLRERYTVEEIPDSKVPTNPDHREVAEWVRVNAPLATVPGWDQHLYYNTVKLYLEHYGRD